jgi:glucose-1-phosphatase
MKPRCPEVRVVLFDLGGVLVELSGVQTMHAWLGGRYSDEELWRKWLASPAIRAFETGRTTSEIFADQLIAEMGLPVGREEFLRRFTLWPRGLFPGALDLVSRIPPRFTRATLSNSNLLHWPRMMHEMGLAEVFDHYFASHLLGKLKPDEDIFQFVIGRLNCAAEEILFLDDNELNTEAARRVGIVAFRAKGVSAAERILIENGILGC